MGFFGTKKAKQAKEAQQVKEAEQAEPHGLNITPYGISVIHEPSNPTHDIVFVHGFDGHPRNTWSAGVPGVKKGLFSQKGTAVFWPKDLLAKEPSISQARIATWGYETNLYQSPTSKTNQLGVVDHARNLVTNLQFWRTTDPLRPLIFVVHSLGGLIVKQALALSRGSDAQTERKSVYLSTTGIIFFGTPHRGSDWAGKAELLRLLTVTAGCKPNTKITAALRPGSDLLNELRDTFSFLLEDGHIHIYSFYEAKGITDFRGFGIVVEEASAVLNNARWETTCSINKDHIQMCKFSSEHDDGYPQCKGALLTLLQRATESEKRGFREWLSAATYERHHNNIGNRLMENSGEWLINSDIYKSWVVSRESPIFWLHGTPGSGKTTLMHCIIKSLKPQKLASVSAGVAYFYCNALESDRTDPASALRSLLFQLSFVDGRYNSSLLKAFREERRQAKENELPLRKLTIGECVDYLKSISKNDPVILAIDALDELYAGNDLVPPYWTNVQRFLEALDTLEQTGNVKIVVSSRDDGIICKWREDPDCLQISSDSRENRGEIERFIHKEIASVIKSKRILCGQVSEELRVKILRTLCEKAERMFLWVRLQIDLLCDPRLSERDVEALLEKLPDNLKKTYDLILGKISELGPHSLVTAQKCMQWLLYSKRALTMPEIISAVSDYKYTIRIEDILQACCNLVFLDAGLECYTQDTSAKAGGVGIIRFIHSTVAEYLQEPVHEDYHEHRSHATILERCVNVYRWEDTPKCPKHNRMLKDYATQFWPYHFRLVDSSKSPIKAMLCGFLTPRQGKRSVGIPFRNWTGYADILSRSLAPPDSQKLENVISEPEIMATPVFVGGCYGFLPKLEELGFLGLLENSWDRKNRRNRTALSLAARFGYSETVEYLLQKHADPNGNVQPGDRTPLLWAAVEGHANVMEVLLKEEYKVDINYRDSASQTALHFAAGSGLYGIVMILLEKGVESDPLSKQGKTPLSWAAGKGHLDTVKVLLEYNADLDSQDENRKTPLAWAAGNGQGKVVEFLIGRGADLHSRDNMGSTPLAWAATNGYKEVVQILLEGGADLNSRDNKRCTPVAWAATNGNTAVVQLLLDEGADANSKDMDRNTPLSWAATNKHISTIKLLLERGADPNSQNCKGSTPLAWAATNGSTDVVKCLLDGNAIIDIEDKDKKTPLSWAAGNGRLVVVEYLLGKGANANSRDRTGGTPLAWAATNGHIAIAEVLLNKGALIDSRDDLGNTPLAWAAGNGHTDMVKLLVTKGAIVRYPDNDKRAPLLRAAGNGHEKAVRALLQLGAQVDPKDENGKTPLLWAASYGDRDIAELLLAYKANANSEDNDNATPLYRAASKGHKEVVKLLLDKGASPNCQTIENESTPLLWAASRGHLAIVKLLIQAGAHLNAQELGGMTPLLWAVNGSRRDIILALLSAGADPNLSEYGSGDTALFKAISRKDEQSAILLLSHNANPMLPNRKGMTPLRMARQMGCREVIRDCNERGYT
ncbi:hypothetical protein MauCBS54593_007003 [Microsporum audouinii]